MLMEPSVDGCGGVPALYLGSSQPKLASLNSIYFGVVIEVVAAAVTPLCGPLTIAATAKRAVTTISAQMIVGRFPSRERYLFSW